MGDLNFKSNNPGAVQFGNFINYYNFHPPEKRISVLPTDIWNTSSIKNNCCTVLDVGCNTGALTAALYKFLTNTLGIKGCNILGLDIDSTLIERACENNTIENCTFKCVDIMSENIGPNIISDYLNLRKSSKFEIVFCFSITMWIHLNHGDDGLKTFLKKVSELSNFLVIEPQQWKCYKTAVKRLKSSNSEFPKYKELKIRQNVEDDIENFILNDCGLVKVKESVRTEWDRKILIFKRVQR